MSSKTQKSEQFRDSQERNVVFNPDHPVHNEAYHSSKTQNLGDQVKRSFASAKDTILSAKDQVHDHFFGASTHPEVFAALPQSEIEKDSIDQEAVKEKLEEIIPLAGMPGPGRYHPHPDNVENIGFPTKVGDKMKAGLESAKGSLVAVNAAIGSTKEYIFGVPVEPIEGGMPGRNHPHPERFYHYVGTPALPNKGNRALVSARARLVSAQTRFLSAKKRVFGKKVVPIEGGMPGRNHPHAERFYAPTPTLMDRVKTGMASAETGLTSAKHAVFGEKVVPIEGGMPGRNHPHPERFEAGLFTRIKEDLFPERSGEYEDKTEAHPVEIQAQSDIDTASIDQEAIKGELEPTLAKETIHPLQGMPGPGRNHPMGDSLTQDESLTKLADT